MPTHKVKIYTRAGDDGTTGLLYGGRVRKDSDLIEATGAVDEAQAAIGLARCQTESGSDLDSILIGLERDLWILMAELSKNPDARSEHEDAAVVTPEMVASLETRIDEFSSKYDMPSEFVVPGQSRLCAALDFSRTVVRRAERACIEIIVPNSQPLAYLNRLSDLLWILARIYEDQPVLAKQARP